MTHYFLHVRNGQGYTRDEEGQDFADLPAARAKAAESVRSIISEEARAGVIDLRGEIEIADAADVVALVYGFGEAIEILQGKPPQGPAGT
ncbi:MAG: hypothetical protein EOP60_05970 [Sphingomonadales bacterium]|nr:MAG: hypothetical protein EOP60_05970 [Sphingomonadales bacterium]